MFSSQWDRKKKKVTFPPDPTEATQPPARNSTIPKLPSMDAFHTYIASTSAYTALQSLPLILSPKMIVNMLSSEAHQTTPVENYFGRVLGITLLTLSILTLQLSGLLPISSSLSEADSTTDPYSYPTAVVTTTYHALSAFYLYTQVAGGFSFGYGSGLALSGFLFCFGVFVCLFGDEKGRVSKTTGADKRTSNFPFTNSESAKEKKKESKRKSVSSKAR